MYIVHTIAVAAVTRRTEGGGVSYKYNMLLFVTLNVQSLEEISDPTISR
jgi:hypothetical protein